LVHGEFNIDPAPPNWITAKIDGTTKPLSNIMFPVHPEGDWATTTAVFLFPNVAAGPHTARIKLASGDLLRAGNRTTLVYHTP
jgi:hypothetical protein